MKIKNCILLCFIFLFSKLFGQAKEIKGKIIASNDLLGIHIVNKTGSKFAISNDLGEFVISARQNDTLLVSGIQYEPKEILITDIIMQTRAVIINLDDNINVLDEVVVGRVLTGYLLTDVNNSDAKRELNFYDFGIPGYTGPRKTQSERRLYEAQTGGGFIPLNPILNWISGRTKKLKAQIVREELELAITEAKAKFSELLFKDDSFSEEMRDEFFYYCGDDDTFIVVSDMNNDIMILQFLQSKLEAFKLHVITD